jgi:hypothetical protein
MAEVPVLTLSFGDENPRRQPLNHVNIYRAQS